MKAADSIHTKEEYEEMKKKCQGLLITEGGKASIYGMLMFVYEIYCLQLFSGAVASVVSSAVLKNGTSLGKRLTWHPFALFITIGIVAPFWIVGESSVIECQRKVFEDRKKFISQNYDLKD